ncbi:VOC family protein [Bacillus sp. B-jedd]|uniref:VOC family protein n=1 Tax=Bacillus sp. B-jedd TaxID=1476857 RepID=UPI0005155737|nr:VOC family protein [Bacillus sp. B-jedd]CEG28208.1 Hypothetical protein BN1002_03092 [Bacillus sp. B-jedd]
MSNIKLDHAVHYANDLDDCIKLFKEKGLTAFRGGSHTKWGTYNALSYFGLFYVEFLGIEDLELAKNPEEDNLLVDDAQKFLPGNEAFGRVALRTNDIEGVRARLLHKGAKASEIIAGKRMNAEGQLIQWRMMMIDGDFNGLPYPFFIQWNSPDEERFRTMTETGVIRPHPAGEVKIDSVWFTVSDPSSAAAHWQEYFDFVPEKPSANNTAALSIGSQKFVFEKGNKNGLSKLVFRTNSQALQGNSFGIGQGEYKFIPDMERDKL